MLNILKIKFKLFFRKPWTFVLLTILTIVFSFLLGQNFSNKLAIPVFSDMEAIEETEIWAELQKSDLFEFEMSTKEEAEAAISEGDVIAGVELFDDSYTIYIASESANVNVLNHYIKNIYSDLYLTDKIISKVQSPANMEIDMNALETVLNESKESPLFSIKTVDFRGEDSFVYDSNLQSIFGFSLFFVIYTIGFNVISILNEKQQGVWDRVILSPVRKWQMYTANLFYSFILGYFQVVLIFSVYRYLIGFDFYGSFGETLIILIPYVFTVVALCIFLISLVKTVAQYNALLSFVAVSFSMLGGAYWPLEIVTSDILITLSKFIPVTYGMEMLKDVSINNISLSDLTQPMLLLMIIGVILMGIGINLMEKKAR